MLLSYEFCLFTKHLSFLPQCKPEEAETQEKQCYFRTSGNNPFGKCVSKDICIVTHNSQNYSYDVATNLNKKCGCGVSTT